MQDKIILTNKPTSEMTVKAFPDKPAIAYTTNDDKIIYATRPYYPKYVFAGKFTNDVGRSNIIKIRNDGSSTYYNVGIPYDPDTKEFAVELPNNFNSLYIGYNAVAASKFIEIYHYIQNKKPP